MRVDKDRKMKIKLTAQKIFKTKRKLEVLDLIGRQMETDLE